MVSHLLHQDFARARTAIANKETLPAGLFSFAAACDAADVAAHLVVITSLMHGNFAVGMHVPHDVLHVVEKLGLGAAVGSTLSAVFGELTAAKAARRAASLKSSAELGDGQETMIYGAS